MTDSKFCMLARYEFDSLGAEIKKYTCNQVRLLQDIWKSEFREKNDSSSIEAWHGRDKAFDKYAQEIDSFLTKCRCNETAETASTVENA